MSEPKESGLSATSGNPAPVLDDRRTVAGNRRAHPRYSFTAAAEVTDLKSHARMNSRISDLGLEGAYVDTSSPFPLGTVVKIRISNGSRNFETRATVVYSLANMGMGLVFAPPEPEQLWVLQKWIGELSGESPSEYEPSISDLQQGAGLSSAESQRAVLQELLTALMRKGTITYAEGTSMLQRLLR